MALIPVEQKTSPPESVPGESFTCSISASTLGIRAAHTIPHALNEILSEKNTSAKISIRSL